MHQIFSLAHDWFKHDMWLNIPQLTLGNSWVIFPNFQNCVCYKKYWRIINTIAFILAQKYVSWIFVLGHYLFLKAHSFLCTMLSKNCLLPWTDQVRRQISEHVFALNGGYCLCNLEWMMEMWLLKQGKIWPLHFLVVVNCCKIIKIWWNI